MEHSFIRYGQKIPIQKSLDQLLQNLNKYCQLAKEQGATDVRIINCSEVMVDERARYKCQYPVCKFYGSNINCPPYTASVDETRQMLKLYRYGIIMVFKCPADRIVASEQANNAHDKRDFSKAISAIESAAFYDGYYFAMGFGSGPCKNVWCAEHDTCSAIEGKGCRYSAFTRASMEAVGMDVYGIVANQGWDIYPIGRSCSSADVPEGTRVALVLVD